jgi:hypothetical protein
MQINAVAEFFGLSYLEASSPMELAKKMTDARLEFRRHLQFSIVFDTKKNKYVAFFDDNTIFKNRSKK